jgi:hypothetical protein
MTSPTPPEVSAALAWLESVAGNEAGMYAEDCAATIRAHIATLEARLAEAWRDAGRLDFIAPGFKVLAGDHVMQAWWFAISPEGKRVDRVASVPANTPDPVRALIDAAMEAK